MEKNIEKPHFSNLIEAIKYEKIKKAEAIVALYQGDTSKEALNELEDFRKRKLTDNCYNLSESYKTDRQEHSA